MTSAQSIAAKLDQEWEQNDQWICILLTKRDTGLMIEGMLERRAWLYDAKRVAREEVRKELLG